ncbi:carbohydrate-binding module family 50 protein [Cadophora sp. DSE1049]|nr:carbohydrate-binding module family 50 protein [Cadophora sp. DSE1049]
MQSLTTLAALASCILPALAQTGTNCDVVANITVVVGDTLGNIATANSVTFDQVLFVNAQITNANLILVGDVIAIPDTACVPGTTTTEPTTPVPCSNSTNAMYTVVAGDTLSTIATDKLGVTLDALLAINPQITNPDLIEIGDVINVPACPATTTASTTPTPAETSHTAEVTATCSTGNVTTYTVVSGDGLFAITTEKFGITLDALLAANPEITNPDLIVVGQVINIPVCGQVTSGSNATAEAIVTPRMKMRKVRTTRSKRGEMMRARGEKVAKAAVF